MKKDNNDDIRESETPERDIPRRKGSKMTITEQEIIEINSDDNVRFPSRPISGSEIHKQVKFVNQFIVITFTFFIIALVLAVVGFSFHQINKLSTLPVDKRSVDPSVYINILLFILGIFCPGPFGILTLQQTKKKK